MSEKYNLFIQKNNTISTVLGFLNFAIYLTVHFFAHKEHSKKVHEGNFDWNVNVTLLYHMHLLPNYIGNSKFKYEDSKTIYKIINTLFPFKEYNNLLHWQNILKSGSQRYSVTNALYFHFSYFCVF